jgi:hypothetical protein
MNKTYNDWLQENFIDICIPTDWLSGRAHLNSIIPYYNEIPNLSFSIIRRDIFYLTKSNIITFLKKVIEHDFYIYLYLDEFYIMSSVNFNKNHFGHDVLVIGLDEANQEFNLYGYDLNNKQTEFTVNFNDLEKAFESLPDRNQNLSSDLILIRPEKCEHIFDPKELKLKFKRYLTVEDIFKHNNTRQFGCNVYKILKEIYAYNAEIVDFRISHKLYEHKKILFDRISYLEKNKYISNFEYINYAREILDLAALVERLTIKAALVQKDKKNKIYSNIITLLNTIESLEKRLLKKIIEDLNKL